MLITSCRILFLLSFLLISSLGHINLSPYFQNEDKSQIKSFVQRNTSQHHRAMNEQCSQSNEVALYDQNVLHHRIKRSFGGSEPINMTLVNSKVVGPMGWIPFSSGSILEAIFYITGYTVLGKKKDH